MEPSKVSRALFGLLGERLLKPLLTLVLVNSPSSSSSMKAGNFIRIFSRKMTSFEDFNLIALSSLNGLAWFQRSGTHLWIDRSGNINFGMLPVVDSLES